MAPARSQGPSPRKNDNPTHHAHPDLLITIALYATSAAGPILPTCAVHQSRQLSAIMRTGQSNGRSMWANRPIRAFGPGTGPWPALTERAAPSYPAGPACALLIGMARGLTGPQSLLPKHPNGTPGKKPPAPSVKVRYAAITSGGKVPADRAGTNLVRIRGRSVPTSGANRVRMSHGLA
jgi:hypothetical protein